MAGSGGTRLKTDKAIGGIVLFLFGGITAILSFQMPIGTFRAAGTGLFPLCLGIILMGLSGLFLLRLFTQKEGEAEKELPVAAIPGSVKPVIFFLGTMALATLGFSHLGFPLTSFLVMLALLKVLGEKRWIYSILLSFITTVASFFLFVQWLKIPLPKGWLGL